MEEGGAAAAGGGLALGSTPFGVWGILLTRQDSQEKKKKKGSEGECRPAPRELGRKENVTG